MEIARWPRRFEYEISKALVSYWHPPKLLLPTRLHSNNSFCLLSFFYLLETVELHLVAEDCHLEALLGVPSCDDGIFNSHPHIPEIAVRQRACDVLHLLLLT